MPQYDGCYDREIKMFTDAMKAKLAANMHKGRDWEKLDLDVILSRLKDEVEELRQAIAGGNTVEIVLEAADIGNFAMIASHIAARRALGDIPVPPAPAPMSTGEILSEVRRTHPEIFVYPDPGRGGDWDHGKPVPGVLRDTLGG